MAGIDKMYGTQREWDQLWAWFGTRELRGRAFCMQMRERPADSKSTAFDVLASFTAEVDRYLWDYCDIAWVQERLHDQYRGRRP